MGPSGQDEQTIAEYTNKLIAHVQRRRDNPGTTSRIGCPITPNSYPLIIAHLSTLSLDDDLHEKAKKVAYNAASQVNYYAKPEKKQKNAAYAATHKAKPEKKAEYNATYKAKPEKKQKNAAYQKAYHERKRKEKEQKCMQEPYQN